MKSRLLSVPAVLLSVMMVISTASSAFAWKVTVTNEADRTATVTCWANAFVANYIFDSKEVAPGQTVTFDTGGVCPSGLEGGITILVYETYNTYKVYHKIESMSLLGNEVANGFFTACCWNSAWAIYKQNDTYHFRKK